MKSFILKLLWINQLKKNDAILQWNTKGVIVELFLFLFLFFNFASWSIFAEEKKSILVCVFGLISCKKKRSNFCSWNSSFAGDHNLVFVELIA